MPVALAIAMELAAATAAALAAPVPTMSIAIANSGGGGSGKDTSTFRPTQTAPVVVVVRELVEDLNPIHPILVLSLSLYPSVSSVSLSVSASSRPLAGLLARLLLLSVYMMFKRENLTSFA